MQETARKARFSPLVTGAGASARRL